MHSLFCRAQAVEHYLGALPCCLWRGIQPFEVPDSHRAQSKAKLGEIATRDLRRVVFWPALIILYPVETHHAAGPGTSRPACSLLRRCLTHPADMQSRQPGPLGVSCNARQAAIDDRIY